MHAINLIWNGCIWTNVDDAVSTLTGWFLVKGSIWWIISIYAFIIRIQQWLY